MEKFISFIKRNAVVTIIVLVVIDFLYKIFYSLYIKEAILNNNVDTIWSLPSTIIAPIYFVAVHSLPIILGYIFIYPYIKRIIKNNIAAVIICSLLSMIIYIALTTIIIDGVVNSIISKAGFSLLGIINKLKNSFDVGFQKVIGYHIYTGLFNIPGRTTLETVRAIFYEFVYALPLVETILLVIHEHKSNKTLSTEE